MLPDALPQRTQHGIERLDTVRVGGLGETGEGKGRDRADLERVGKRREREEGEGQRA